VEVPFGVAYSSDLPTVERVLLEVARAHPQAFDEPAPEVRFSGFGASSVDGLFRVWTLRANAVPIRSALVVQVKQAFDEAGIEIPFPQQVVHHRSPPPTFDAQ
jgi:small-conductance mechanosensitive channel